MSEEIVRYDPPELTAYGRLEGLTGQDYSNCDQLIKNPGQGDAFSNAIGIDVSPFICVTG